MLRLIDRLAERVEVSTTDRQVDVHILCIDDVVARASDMAVVAIFLFSV
jgi:hypothetical protein